MDIRKADTAVVFIDPQNDVLSEKGANWGTVGASVTENRTVENMERIFKAAKANEYEVFISPHYFYPTDNSWKFNGPLEADEFATGTFARQGALDLSGFEGSGADWMPEFKAYIDDGKTVVVSRAVFSTARSPNRSAHWIERRVRPSPILRSGTSQSSRRTGISHGSSGCRIRSCSIATTSSSFW